MPSSRMSGQIVKSVGVFPDKKGNPASPDKTYVPFSPGIRVGQLAGTSALSFFD